MYFTHPQFKDFSLKPFLRGFSEIDLKNKLNKVFPNYYITFTDSGRSAFQLAIQGLNLQNSEMLFPAYVCDIFKPILEKYNIKPIYLDTNLKTFHSDLTNIGSKMTPDTKSILICHTYGLPVDMDKIIEIAKKYNLKIIEDCAHFPLFGLPRVDSRGDVLFFSFAKLFPVVGGGMLVSKNPIKITLPKYKLKPFNIVKFFRLFPILARFSELFRVDSKEIQGENSMGIPRGISKKTLRIFDWYLNGFTKQISDREKLAEYFHKKLREIKYQSSGITYISALVPKNTNRDELFNKLRKRGVFCSRIWHNPLHPELPNTKQVAEQIINFPLQNWFEEKDIDKIISCILSSKG